MRKRYFWSIFLMLYVESALGSSLTPAMKLSVQGTSILQLIIGAMKAVGLGGVGVTECSIRKAAYFSGYTLLGTLLVQCLTQYGLLVVTRRQLHGLAELPIPFVGGALQPFIGRCSGQISDAWLDCAGVLFDTVLSLAVGRRHRRRKGKKNAEEKLQDGGPV